MEAAWRHERRERREKEERKGDSPEKLVNLESSSDDSLVVVGIGIVSEKSENHGKTKEQELVHAFVREEGKREEKKAKLTHA